MDFNSAGLDDVMSLPGRETWLNSPPPDVLQPSAQSCGSSAALEQENRTSRRAAVCSWGRSLRQLQEGR